MNFNFELILFYATLVTGLLSLFDVFFLAPKRKRAHKKKLPVIMDYARSFFPVLLMVFLCVHFYLSHFVFHRVHLSQPC